MKKDNKTVKKEMNPPEKWRKIALWSLIGAAVIAVVLAISLPFVKIASDMENIIEKMTENREATISITDMAAENVFGNEKGEAVIVSGDILDKLESICDDMRYNGKKTDSLGAWDIRFRVNGEEIYLAEDRVYYVSDSGVQYDFVPMNDEAMKEYKAFYGEIEELLK